MEKPDETKTQQQSDVASQGKDPKNPGQLKERKPHFTCTVIKPTETTSQPPPTSPDGTSTNNAS